LRIDGTGCKYLMVLLWLVGCAVLLSGCGQQTNNSNSASVTNAAPPKLSHQLEDVTNFPYPPGTVLAAHAAKGQYSLLKVLRVDRTKVQAGQHPRVFIHYRTYEDLYPSLAAARTAASSPHLKVRVAHGVAQQGFLERGVQAVAHVPVRENELAGYHKWRKAYEAGQADVVAM